MSPKKYRQVEKACIRCGTEFTSCSSQLLRLCETCRSISPSRRKNAGKIIECKKCGTSFVKTSNRSLCDNCRVPSKPRAKRYYDLTCKRCGGEFSASLSFTKYCDSCRGMKSRNSETCVCVTCGSSFVPARKTARFCSRSCSSQWVQGSGLGQQAVFTEEEVREKIHALARKLGRGYSLDELETHTGVTEKMLHRKSFGLTSCLAEIGYESTKTLAVAHDGKTFGSNFELQVYKAIRTLTDVVIETHYCFEDCRGLGGHPLRFDFYLPELNLIVEADGNQHQGPDPSKPWMDDPRAHDKIKNKYCKDKGITLVRIKYFRRVTEDAFVNRVERLIKDRMVSLRSGPPEKGE